MKRWVFNFAFFFALIFWIGLGVLAGFYAVEIGILMLGKTSQTSKFMSQRGARKAKRGLQSNMITLGALQAGFIAYYNWNSSWLMRWFLQGGATVVFFVFVTGYTHYRFKEKYMKMNSAAPHPPPYHANEHTE